MCSKYMSLKNKLETIFGKNNLVYACSGSLINIAISDKTRDLILNIGIPHVISYFRFSMDFEPLSQDFKIGIFAREIGNFFTIGCVGVTQLIGRNIELQEIGLRNNASLTKINNMIELLEIDDAVFCPEVNQAVRICFDLDCEGEIKCVSPIDLSVSFLNSSIEQLLNSLILFDKCFSKDQEFENSINLFKKQLEIIDPRALEKQDNMWCLCLEQMMLDSQEY
jgi:hypothetical protein